MVRTRLAYARHWLRFKIKQGLFPQAAVMACSINARSIRFHKYGFVTFFNGKSLSVSWRFWAEGPCNYATFAWLRGDAMLLDCKDG